MNTLTLKRLVLAVLVLLMGWGLITVLRGDLGEEIERRSWPGVQGVTSVLMARPHDTLALMRGADGQWTVNGLEPSVEQVDATLALLAAGLRGDLASRTVASHERLGVDDVNGVHVTVYRGEERAMEFWFGRPGQVMHSIYMRVAGDSAVYHYQGRLAALFTQDRELWRERLLSTVRADTVAAVTVVRPRGGYTLRREDEWRLRGAETDSTQVAQILSELGNLRARTFATEDDLAGSPFRTPRQVVLLDVVGDTVLALQLDSTAAGWLVRRRAGGTVWRLEGWQVERIMPSDSALLRTDP